MRFHFKPFILAKMLKKKLAALSVGEDMGKGEIVYVIDGNLLPVCTLVQPLWRAISKIIWQFSVSQRCTHLWASNSIPNRDLETLSRGYTRDTSWQQQKIRNNLSICQQEHRLITFGVVIYKSQVDWYISTWTEIKRWVTKASCRMIHIMWYHLCKLKPHKTALCIVHGYVYVCIKV